MYDLIVIGGGPAGYPSAIKASQYGLKTAIVEKEHVFGGTCLNWGCIPTKAYFESCHLISRIKSAHKYGLGKIEEVNFSLEAIKERKDRLVKNIVKGVEYLLKKNSVDIYQGHASFADAGTVNVSGGQTLRSKHFLIATGSRPAVPGSLNTGDPGIITSNEILELTAIPRELCIIGAGAIGLEFASIFNILGSKVTIVEMLDSLAPLEDREISAYLAGIFSRKRIKAYTSAMVQEISREGDRLKVLARISGGDIEISADKVLISAGRRPNTENLGLDSVNISTDRGTIPVNEFGQTAVKNIYAAGDIINTPQLAHVATAEGLRAVDHIMGKESRINYDAVPSFIYSMPEISRAGLTEKELSSRGTAFQKAVFPLKAIAKAQITGDTDGFIKMLYDDKKLLGFHMIGALAPELVFEPTLAINAGLGISDLSRTIHAHPTIGEAIMETAHLAEGFPIHVLKS